MSLAVGFLPRSTSAQGAALLDHAKEQERTSLYREGVSLAETGHWPQALKKFETVVAMRSAPAALVALATAQEKAGKLASAKQTFLKARADAQALGDTELAQKAEKARTALEDRIARIVVLLPADTSGAEVAIDGSPATADPKGIEADPGEHHGQDLGAVVCPGHMTNTCDMRMPTSYERLWMGINWSSYDPPTSSAVLYDDVIVSTNDVSCD